MDEIWKEIEGTNGCYFVSTFGRVYSAPRRVKFGIRERYTDGTIIKPREKKNGYLQVGIFGKTTTFTGL